MGCSEDAVGCVKAGRKARWGSSSFDSADVGPQCSRRSKLVWTLEHTGTGTGTGNGMGVASFISLCVLMILCWKSGRNGG